MKAKKEEEKMIKKNKENIEERGGKKQRLTPEIKNKLVEIIAAGHTKQTACESIGIAPSTLYSWIARGERRKSKLCIELVEEIRKAEAKAKMLFVETIKKATEKNWQAAAWLLERRWPDEFAIRLKQDLQHSGKIVIKVGKELDKV